MSNVNSKNKGAAGKGRKNGSPNKVPGILKAAIMKAAEDVGEDGDGFGGLDGYLRDVAKKDKKSFTALLGKILPTELNAKGNVKINVVKVDH